MTKTPAVRGLLAGFVLLVGSVTQTFGQQYDPAQLIDPRLAPKHDDVSISTPTAEEIKKCTVELVKGTTPGSNGWVLKDSNNKPLRRFFDSNGDRKPDIWSYYKDGVEVYREFDTAHTGQPNNFRWLNGGGMKWGVGGVNAGKAYIDNWRMISAEEAGFEAFQAIAKRDYARLKSLFITDADMQMLKLTPAASERISKIQQSVSKKFEDIAKKISLDGARFERLESAIPSCTTDDSSEAIVIKYASRPILYSLNNKHEWLHTGEIIQVGMAWRLVDVPGPESTGGPIMDTMPKELQKLYDEISELDRMPPPPVSVLAKDAKADAFYRKRIALVQKIIPLDKAEQRETWYKQLLENLTSLAQNSGDQATIDLLKQLKDDFAAKMPGSNLAAYGHYRFIWTGYAIGMAKADPKQMSALQEKWLEQLSDFVKKYARAEDTPEALHQLAIGTEFGGQDEAAKRWYTQLHENFPDHSLAPRAKGSVARLNLPGKELKLSAPLLDDNTKTFDVSQLRGKFVLVHYWASYSNNFADDFVRLKRTMDQVGQKYGVELVCVNLDDTAQAARAALKGLNAPGYHLFQAPSNNAGAGLSSPLAVQYGIHMLPTMFMVGKDGKVTSRAMQIADIETELKRVQ